MSKTIEKVITLDNFYGGIAETDLDIYSRPGEAGYIQGVDIIRDKDFLRPGLDMVTDANGDGFDDPTNGESAQVRGYVKRSGSNVIYAVQFGNDTDPSSTWRSSILTKSSLTGNWGNAIATQSTDDGAGEPVFGIWELGGNLYFIRKKTAAGAAGYVIDQYAIGSTTYTEVWDNLNVAAWGSQVVATQATGGGALLHTDGNLYFWIQRYIGPYDGTTKPSAVTPFSIPANYSIIQAISYGHYILCAANDSSASSVTGSARTSKLFLIDPYSNVGIYTYDDVYDTGTYDVRAIALVEGGIKIITSLTDYYIWDWVGGQTFVKEKRLNVASATDWSVTSGNPRLHSTAVDVKDNILYMGTNCSVSGFGNGVYAYGRERTEDPKVIYNAFINHSDDTSSVEYRAVKWITDAGVSSLHASWYDGTNYRMSRSSTARDTANFLYDSIYFRPWRNLKSQCVKATFFHAPLGASDRFTFSMKRDDDSSFTEVDTSIGTTNASETILRNNQSGLTNNFLKGWRHKTRLAIASAGTTTKIEAIKMRFRTVEQE